MSVLVLRLAGPLQSWGDSSRFVTRGTRREPTKSGVLGMVAAALGRGRTDSVDDLAALRFGVRVDQPGTVARDYHTVATGSGKAAHSILTERWYLADSVFVVGLEGDESLLITLATALEHPVFSFGLGRRSCPPDGRIVLGVVQGGLDDALRATPWQASSWHQRRQAKRVALDVQMDAGAGQQGDVRRDVPISFDMTHRQYGWRGVVSDHVTLDNPQGHDRDDWFAALGSA